jgi:hypothetical protein
VVFQLLELALRQERHSFGSVFDRGEKKLETVSECTQPQTTVFSGLPTTPDKTRRRRGSSFFTLFYNFFSLQRKVDECSSAAAAAESDTSVAPWRTAD